MKRLFQLLILTLLTSSVFAQSDNFIMAEGPSAAHGTEDVPAQEEHIYVEPSPRLLKIMNASSSDVSNPKIKLTSDFLDQLKEFHDSNYSGDFDVYDWSVTDLNDLINAYLDDQDNTTNSVTNNDRDIEEGTEDELHVYIINKDVPFPNPSSTEINFNLSGDESTSTQIMIFNTQGQLVQQTKSEGGRKIQINTANLPTGQFYYQLRNADGVKSGTIQKVN